METMRHRIPLLLLSCGLWACSCAEEGRPSTAAAYALTTTAYAVLAEKAITYQADFDWEGFAGMLAEEVEYQPVDSTRPLVGKPAVLTWWRAWPQQSGVCSVRLGGFTHIPLQLNQPLPVSGKAGVYVITYCTAEVHYADGHRYQSRMHLCCHFNADKRIDRYMVFNA